MSDHIRDPYDKKLAAQVAADAAVDGLLDSLADLKQAIVDYHEAESQRLAAIGAKHTTARLYAQDLLGSALGGQHPRLAMELARFMSDPGMGRRDKPEHRIHTITRRQAKQTQQWVPVDKGERFDKGQLLQHVNDPTRWFVRVYVGMRGKRRKYAGRTVYGSRSDAESVLSDMLRAANSGRVEPRKRMMLAEYLRDYYLPHKAEAGLADSALRGYRQTIESNIIPRVGRASISSMTTQRVTRLYADIKKAGASGRPVSIHTVKYAHAVLSDAFAHAVDLGMVPFNPCREARLPG